MNAMAAALVKAGVVTDTAIPASAGQPEKPKKKVDLSKKKRAGPKKGRWGTSSVPNMIEWEHPEIGAIQIELKPLRFGEHVYQDGPNTWRRIRMGDHRPSSLTLECIYNPNSDVEFLYGLGQQLFDIAKQMPKPFEVPITWTPGSKPDDHETPSLPHDATEDFQIFGINRTNGFLVHLDVSIVSRNGSFWVTVQEVLGARIVWHSSEIDLTDYSSIEIGDRSYSLVPVYDENCYPGNDPVASIERSYKGRSRHLLRLAAGFNAAIPAEECDPGMWQPQWPAEVPDELKKKGYQSMIIQWFNLTIGWGWGVLENGRPVHVHFKQIQDENGNFVAQQGDFPVVQPGKPYYAKLLKKDPKQSDDGKEKSTAVRPALAV